MQPDQRKRLLRSTRKLGTVLGTVPVIEESTSNHKGKLSLSLAPHTDSHSLVLRLQSIPSLSQPPSPLSPTFSTNRRTSVSSVLSEPQCSTRRKKMAKLTRTLGENIPPELVFPDARPINRHRSRSIDSFILIQTTPPPSHSLTPVSFDHLDDKNSTLDLSLKDLSSSPVSEHTPLVSTSTEEHGTLRKRFVSRRPSKLFHKLPHRSTGLERASSLAHSPSRATFRTRNGGSGRSLDVQPTFVEDEDKDSHRKGREWSGQWNVDDMEEVTRKLRGLKAK